jgi:hypothetical protein
MGRSWLCVLYLVGGFSAAGCTDYGDYEVTWQFVGGTAESVKTDCGFHGVDSIRVIGTNTEGDREDISSLCWPGKLTHGVPVGTWTFAVHQIGVRGMLIDPKDANDDPVAPTAGAVLKKDGPPTPLDASPIMLMPRPVCTDGIDNDRDGRVDADDPECVADPNSATE